MRVNDRKSRLSLLLMLALIGGTAWFLLSRQPLSSLGAALRQVRLWCVPGGLGLMTAFVGCEAMCSRLILGRLGHKVTYRQCLGYSFAGFYVSSITPSSTGGQPAQIYYMSRDGVPAAHGALNMMLIAVCYQVVVIGYALAVALLRFDLVANLGGGLGLLPKRDSFYEALDALPGVHTTIITGNNRKLYDRLAGKYAHIEVLGFTDRVYDYMARADLVLTKPGGITLFETIFSELPILAWEPFLEQEKNNARFLVKRGLGRVAAKEPEECLSAIRALIYDDETLEWMAGNMRAMKGQLEEESLNRMLAGLEAEKGVRVG